MIRNGPNGSTHRFLSAVRGFSRHSSTNANHGLTGLAQFLATVTSGDARVCVPPPVVSRWPPGSAPAVVLHSSAQVASARNPYCAWPSPQRRAANVTSVCSNATPFQNRDASDTSRRPSDSGSSFFFSLPLITWQPVQEPKVLNPRCSLTLVLIFVMQAERM